MKSKIFRTDAIKLIGISRAAFMALNLPYITVENQYNRDMNSYLYDKFEVVRIKRELEKKNINDQEPEDDLPW